jgi:L-idonate 5-dehydrogenase
MAEPLSVVLHAAGQAVEMLGRRVLVTGCGPIGMLAILVARLSGAAEVVATDIAPFTLAKASDIGADRTINVLETPGALQGYAADKGHFDVLFECSGVAAALASTIPAMRPGGVIVQLGLGGDMTLPVQAMTAKELQLRGSFRFHAEFFTAVDLMRSGRLNVAPLITQTLPMDDAVAAFDLASDRSQAVKAQIAFS